MKSQSLNGCQVYIFPHNYVFITLGLPGMKLFPPHFQISFPSFSVVLFETKSSNLRAGTQCWKLRQTLTDNVDHGQEKANCSRQDYWSLTEKDNLNLVCFMFGWILSEKWNNYSAVPFSLWYGTRLAEPPHAEASPTLMYSCRCFDLCWINWMGNPESLL